MDRENVAQPVGIEPTCLQKVREPKQSCDARECSVRVNAAARGLSSESFHLENGADHREARWEVHT
jgi:hypothetical protein